MVKAEEDAQFTMNKRRGVVQEKREAKLEKDEAERYQNLKDDLNNKNIQLYLVQLFFAEHSRQKAKEDLRNVRTELDRVQGERSEREEVVTSKQKEHRKLMKDLKKLENAVEEKDKEICKFKPQVATNKQELAHIESKLETAKKMHNAAAKMAETQEQNLRELEKRQS